MEDNTKDNATVELREISNAEAKALATSYFHPVVWSQIKGMAQTFIQSKALPKHIQNAAQAVLVLQAGYEMGMKPMEAVNSVYIVNGATNIWGKATVRRLREHGYFIEYVEEDNEHCKARVYKENEEYIETFLFKDAEESGWTKDSYGKLKVGWKAGQNRKLKMRYGALSAIIKSYIPDVLGSANDIVEVAEDVTIIDVPEVEEKPKEKEGVAEPKSLSETLAQEGEIVEPEQPSEPDAELRTLQKEYFAITNEAGIDAETAKETAKQVHKVESFNDISATKLKLYNKVMRVKLRAKQAQEAKAEDEAPKEEEPKKKSASKKKEVKDGK